jgi:hypothetical protein
LLHPVRVESDDLIEQSRKPDTRRARGVEHDRVRQCGRARRIAVGRLRRRGAGLVGVNRPPVRTAPLASKNCWRENGIKAVGVDIENPCSSC